jgi:hypothetical protein
MAITSGQLTIGTTRQQIDGLNTNYQNLIIQNDSNTTKLLIGGSDLTLANGMKLSAGQTVQILVPPLQSLWIMSDTENHAVSWLRWDV